MEGAGTTALGLYDSVISTYAKLVEHAPEYETFDMNGYFTFETSAEREAYEGLFSSVMCGICGEIKEKR